MSDPLGRERPLSVQVGPSHDDRYPAGIGRDVHDLTRDQHRPYHAVAPVPDREHDVSLAERESSGPRFESVLEPKPRSKAKVHVLPGSSDPPTALAVETVGQLSDQFCASDAGRTMPIASM
jgi:hypothetical protein